MTKEAVKHIIRRCLALLKREGTKKNKEEYHFWKDWLNKEIKKYKNDKDIISLIDKDNDLKKDLKFK